MRKSLLSLLLYFIVLNTLLGQNCSINAGLSSTICLSDSMKLFGTRSGLFSPNSTSQWSQTSGPKVKINKPESLITFVTGFASGTYNFVLKNKCQDGINSEDSISIIVLPQTIANAGDDTILCPGNDTKLYGSIPLANYEKGQWIIITNGVGVTISSPSDPNSPLLLSPSSPGISKLRWTITNFNGCSSYDDIQITNCGGVMPVNAGPDQNLDDCFAITTCAKLVASNGGVGFGNQLGTWSLVSGPTVPVISQVNKPITTVCNLSSGSYIFRYTVIGPCAEGVDDVKITVPLPNHGIPNANSNILGKSTSICDGSSTITLTGNTPEFSGEMPTWIQTSGPVVVNINTPNNPSTVVTGLTIAGAYTFKYTISNITSGCSGNSDVRFVLYESGTINAGPDQILPCNVQEAIILPNTTGYGYINYRIINGPIGAFNYPTVAKNQNNIKGLKLPGTYRVEVSYQFGPECPAINDFVDITVSLPPTGSNAGSSQNFTCSSTSTQLAGNNPILTGIGTGRWSQISGPGNAILANPTNFICDIKNAIPGSYTFRWTISGGNNCPDNHANILVILPDSLITKANAGNDKTICFNSPITLQGNPFRADETSKWTINPSAGITFTPSNTVNNPTIDGLAANTTYTLVYTIMNSCNSITFDSINITTSENVGPSNALAGSDQCIAANTNSIMLNANNPVSGIGNWTQIEGPIAIITNPLLPNTSITSLVNGNYKFVWTITTNRCFNETIDTVKITISNNTTIANAGIDKTICGNTITLEGNKPEFGIGQWSQISGDGNAIINSIYNPITVVDNLSNGSYTFRWTISNNSCPSNFDDVIFKISTTASTANAGNDQILCNNITNTTLEAITPTAGTGQWVWVSGSGNYPTIANSNSPNTLVSKLGNGVHIFRWIVSGGEACPQSSDDIMISVSPLANAGLDKALCNLTSTELKGNAGTKGTWSQINGPNVSLLQTPVGNPNTNIYGLLPDNSYTFRYTITNSINCPVTFDDIKITNSAPILAPNAGIDNEYCNITSINLNASIPKNDERGNWTIVSGQKDGTFLPNANTPNATLTNISNGVYLLKWTISNGVCGNSDIKRIDNFSVPTKAFAGPNDTICAVNSILLHANSPTSGIGKWKQISGPNSIIFDAPNNPITRVLEIKVGTYRFSWVISNNSCAESSDDIDIVILNNTDNTYAGNDQNICSSSTSLNANKPLGNNKGIWSQHSGPNKATFSAAENPINNLSNLTPGLYKFIWKIYNERCFNTDTVIVIVSTSVKVYAGEDLSICNQTKDIKLNNATVIGYTNVGSWSIVSGEGTLSSTAATNMPSSIIFSPAPNYSGVVILRLSASDNCNLVTDDIKINIEKTVSYIDAINDTVRTDPNTTITINVLKNDKILIGDELKLCSKSINTRPSHGSAIVNGDGTITYKPVTGYLGIDSFNYKLCNKTSNIDLLNLGCFSQGNDNAWVYIMIEGCTIPNSFSPDGDGVNDFFEIPCARGDVEFSVFNRWGIEVFKSKSYKNDWNGTYNDSPLPDGTYFYLLKYSSESLEKLSKNGFISLRR